MIRDILQGRLAADPDPHGLRLRGARITGRIDLKHLVTDLYFELTDYLLEAGLLARDARLAYVALTGCHLKHPAEPPLDAAWLTCNVLTLTRATIISHAAADAVSLVGARIGGVLQCDGADLRSDFGPALNANGLQADQGVLLRGGFTATAMCSSAVPVTSTSPGAGGPPASATTAAVASPGQAAPRSRTGKRFPFPAWMSTEDEE